MIIFVNHGRHSYTHQDLVGQPGLGQIGVCNYHWLLGQKRLPKGSYIFTDRERMDSWELRVYGALFRHINLAGEAYRAVNDPAKMHNRRGLLRALHSAGLNDFNAYAVTERRLPSRWPVFVRREFDHGKPLTGLLNEQDELTAALAKLNQAGEPEEGLLVVEYCAEPVSENLFRKLSVYRIGEQTVFCHSMHEASWLVKYGTLNCASHALYEDEQRMVRENAFSAELGRAFDIGGIQYGRADFGLVNGRVQVYEINSNPSVKRPQVHPNPVCTRTRQLAWEKYCTALSALDSTDPGRPFAPAFEHPDLFRSPEPSGFLDVRIRRH